MFLVVLTENVLRILTSSGLMNYVNAQHIFVTVHDAVVYIENQRVSKILDLIEKNCIFFYTLTRYFV